LIEQAQTVQVIDDELLVRRAQGGDRAAFEQIVRRTARLVYARVYLDVADRQRAEDIVQETFLIAWKRIGQVVSPGGFRTWLLTIARTAAADAHRRRSRKKRRGSEADLSADVAMNVPDPAPTPADRADRREQQERMLGMLRRLPEEYSVPITLRYIAGDDYDAIGRQLGLTNGSLRGLLNRGMTRLREMMSDDEHE
jgi:RNA polymerase sigma-70 factor (ECF subfamily)